MICEEICPQFNFKKITLSSEQAFFISEPEILLEGASVQLRDRKTQIRSLGKETGTFLKNKLLSCLLIETLSPSPSLINII